MIVRPAVVYGPRDTDVLQMFRSIGKGLVLEISGGERWFQAIYVKDLADGLLAAARSPDTGGRAYFLAHAQAVSWSDLSSAAARIMGKRTRVLRIPAFLAYAVGGFAEVCSQLTGKPGIISREKVREAGAAIGPAKRAARPKNSDSKRKRRWSLGSSRRSPGISRRGG